MNELTREQKLILIARFMDVPLFTRPAWACVLLGCRPTDKWYYDKLGRQQIVTTLNYDDSWNSLMKVIKRINELDLKNKDWDLVGIRGDILRYLQEVDIEKTFEYVVKFITLYKK